jgi:signal transduction histidine kinase/ActR/RegA family two-component response regulator
MRVQAGSFWFDIRSNMVTPPSPLNFRALFESAPGLNLVLSPDWTIVAVSDAYLEATRTRRAEICGKHLFEVFPDNPDDPEATGEANLRASLERVALHKRTDAMAVQKYDIRVPASEGGGFVVRYWSPTNAPVLGEDGTLLYIVHTVHDVTEFVRLKQSHSEERRRSDDLQDRAERMEAEIFLRAQDLQQANAQLRALQAELEQRVRARTADLERTNAALQESEEQLRQAQKLEAVGRLAGGVAHDFNNVLTAILGQCQLMRLHAGGSGHLVGEISEVEKAADRAARLTRQLLAFSRQQILRPRVLDLNAVIVEMDGMLRRLIGEDVVLVTVPGEDLGRVEADPGQIEQVVMNLVVNSRDAMPAGGRLTIETANVTFADARGACVLLAVTDDGTGMSPEVRSRIFEPFFTTKGAGVGTGLGLAMVHGIVKQSGGSLEVDSAPGEGTAIRIYLPRVEASLDRPDAPRERQRLDGHETILVIEDDDVVRTVVCATLRLHGYHVCEAGDRAAALVRLEEARRSGVPIDVIVSDVVMPGMTIAEFAGALRTLEPGARILYMSGYADRAVTHHGWLGRDSAFLQKPFTTEELLRKVRDLLGDARRDAA